MSNKLRVIIQKIPKFFIVRGVMPRTTEDLISSHFVRTIKKVRTINPLINSGQFLRFLLPSHWLKKIPKEKKRYVDLIFGGLLVVLIPLAISLTIHPAKSETVWPRTRRVG